MLVESGELAPRSFADYHATCKRLIAIFGANRFIDDLASDDFERLRDELAKTLGPVALGNEMQRTRIVFRFGYAGAAAAGRLAVC